MRFAPSPPRGPLYLTVPSWRSLHSGDSTFQTGSPSPGTITIDGGRYVRGPLEELRFGRGGKTACAVSSFPGVRKWRFSSPSLGSWPGHSSAMQTRYAVRPHQISGPADQIVRGPVRLLFAPRLSTEEHQAPHWRVHRRPRQEPTQGLIKDRWS